jgi:hypothetical protein
VFTLICGHPEELDVRGDGDVRERDAIADNVVTLAALRVDRRGEPVEPCRNAGALLRGRQTLDATEVGTHAKEALVVQRLAGLVEDLIRAGDPHEVSFLSTRSSEFRAKEEGAAGRTRTVPTVATSGLTNAACCDSVPGGKSGRSGYRSSR